MNEDQPNGQDQDQQKAIIVRSDQVTIERFGFSLEFPALVTSLNDTLSRLEENKPEGFYMEFYPDLEYPASKVELKFPRQRPFKVEVAGGLARGNASVRVRSQRNEWSHRSSVSLGDLQSFASATFPGRNVTIHAEPAIRSSESVVARRKLPNNLYEEETDPEGKEELESLRRQSAERILWGILPDINMNLQDLTDEELGKLTDQVRGMRVDATFYQPSASRKRSVSKRVSAETGVNVNQLYSDFEIRLDDKTIMRLYVDSILYGHEHVGTYCQIKELYFYGTPQEVEDVIRQFIHLMQQTQSYQKSE